MLRLLYYFFIIYLLYRGVQFVFRFFASLNTGHNSGTSKGKDKPSPSTNSKFKDVEEAKYTDIKDDEKKDPDNG